MDSDKQLAEIIEQALAPLDSEVGTDLAAENPAELTHIRDEFSQSNRDFPQLLELGQGILTGRSKDLWALWALVGGILWSQRFEPNNALAATCRLTCELCKRYWKKMYPNSIGLRNTLMANIVKWWNTFLIQKGSQLDPTLLRQCSRELQSLSEFLVRQVGANESDARRKFPMLPGLAYVAEGMITLASRPPGQAPAVPAPQAEPSPAARAAAQPKSETAAEDWWETDSLAEFDLDGEGLDGDATETIVTEPTANQDSLEQAFLEALRGIQAGQAMQSVQRFEKLLENQRSLAAHFRGQVMLGELYLRAGDARLARRTLEQLHHMTAHIRLSDWEPELCTRLWETLLQSLQSGGTTSDGESLAAEANLQLHRIHPTGKFRAIPPRKV